MSVAWYRCLECGKPLSATLNATVEEADRNIRTDLHGKCPNCGRILNKQSRKLTDMEESEFRYKW